MLLKQKEQAEKDLEILRVEKERALEDPASFVEDLMQKVRNCPYNMKYTRINNYYRKEIDCLSDKLSPSSQKSILTNTTDWGPYRTYY